MSYKRKRNRQTTKIVGSMIGLILVFTFVLSLLNIDIRSSSDDSGIITVTPLGTPPPPTPVIIPTPDPDPQLAGKLVYIHSSGYFQTFQPAGDDWFSDEALDTSTSALARVAFQSVTRLAVIHNYIQPGVEFDSLESLSQNYLTEGHFAGAWSDYDNWQETGRTITENAVIVNFTLVTGGHAYLGRTVVKLDNAWLYVTRLVVPNNNPALLDLLEQMVIPAFTGYHTLQELPQTWPTYIDRQLGFLLKYPYSWQQVAGGIGRPVTFKPLPDQPWPIVRLWTEPDSLIESDSQANLWIAIANPTAKALEVAPVERQDGRGFQVAYTFRDSAGDAHSGLVTLLNDAEGQLYVADLQIDSAGVNLLHDTEKLDTNDREAQQAVSTGFIVLPPESRQTP